MYRFKVPDGEVPIVDSCEHCRGEIYAGDDVYRVAESGAFVHEDCAKEYAYAHVYDAQGVIIDVVI